MIVYQDRKPLLARPGAHMVEFALVIPVFFLFIFAFVEIGRAMMVSSLVSNAARIGCRTGVLPGKSNSDVATAVADLLGNQGITGHTTTIQVNGADKNVNTAETSDMITVVVSVPIAQTSWVPALSFLAGNITGQYSMPHE